MTLLFNHYIYSSAIERMCQNPDNLWMVQGRGSVYELWWETWVVLVKASGSWKCCLHGYLSAACRWEECTALMASEHCRDRQQNWKVQQKCFVKTDRCLSERLYNVKPWPCHMRNEGVWSLDLRDLLPASSAATSSTVCKTLVLLVLQYPFAFPVFLQTIPPSPGSVGASFSLRFTIRSLSFVKKCSGCD